MRKYLNLAFKAKTYTLCVCLLLFTAFACKQGKGKEEKTSTPISFLQKTYKNCILKAYEHLDSINLTEDVNKKKQHYRASRKYFKISEPVLSYIEKDNYKSLNSPNLLKVREDDLTDIKINKPIGFQVIEESLFVKDIDSATLAYISKITSNRLKLIYNNTQLSFKNYHIMWLLKDHIVRVATVGLSNFDSPVLGQSLLESKYAYEGMSTILSIYEDEFKNKELYKNWQAEIKKSKEKLLADFDTFDRYDFIENHTNIQLELWNATVKDWNVKFPFELALKNDLSVLFSSEAFNFTHFSDYRSDTIYLSTKIKLGKKLFNDKRLSIKSDMSCATCHNKDKAFTDGKVTFNKHIKRNTPTLTYAGLQKSFFYDNRSGSLEGQIVGVVTNHDEFNSNLEHIVNVVKKDNAYAKAFDSLYTRGTTDMNIRHSMAAYVRSLNSFNSKFDNNINGKEHTLTKPERDGFNLFMGKAACATCHFPPLFNGTVPPHFTESELEIIGVPKTKENKELDDDLGRYYLFNTEERKGAFKTPTIRNVGLTAPYMHNGVYTTLEDIVDFYNKGGGAGLGFNVPYQTLPFDNLDLTEKEQKDLVAFMKTLNDNY